MEVIQTEVLVVGGGTGGTAAAIQAARRGAQTLLVSEFPWLGGMLTAAGVAAPDGNELLAWQTGLWGAFLQALRQRQAGGLDHAWVSFFTYEPAVGAAIFADWVAALPNLDWRWGHLPKAVLRQGDRITGVAFDEFTVQAQITLDGTELGDLLALGEVPYRWGWEPQSQWQEPSAPLSLDDPQGPLYPILQHYPVQAPTWVVVMQDYGQTNGQANAPAIAPTLTDASLSFAGAWADYTPETFLNYGRLPNNRFMINWPQNGNDYGVDLHRLIRSETDRAVFWQAAKDHSQAFAHHIQTALGQRYGLAANVFPTVPGSPGGGAFALYPYYRESRRLVGLTTVHEQAILPIPGGQVAPLPVNEGGEVSAIAIGNYANDHHYPGFTLPLAPKTLQWGGRRTGTPFTIPYEALIPARVDGLLVCDKNLSVSHIANGATRLQPIILSIGQAAGMAAALCIESQVAPRSLPVRKLQTALLEDAIAPLAVIPCFDLLPNHPLWAQQQQAYLHHPENYPASGNCEAPIQSSEITNKNRSAKPILTGQCYPHLTVPCDQLAGSVLSYDIRLDQSRDPSHDQSRDPSPHSLSLVTLHPQVQKQLSQLTQPTSLAIQGTLNPSGNWLLAEAISTEVT